MKVNQIQINNIGNIEELAIQPGTITVVSGRNGAGKTSVLNAIRAVLSGGHEPDLIRKGAEQGTIVVTLDDGVQVAKRITPEKSTLVVRHPQYGKISKAQAWLREIVDELSVDPIAFMHADPRERNRLILEAMPLTVTREQIVDCVGEIDQWGLDLGRHALDVIAVLREKIYSARTELNRASAQAAATADKMAASLPTAVEGGWKQRHDLLRGDFQRLQKETLVRMNEVKSDAQEAQAAVTALAEQKKAEAAEEYRKRLAEIDKQREEEVTEIIRSRDATLESLQAEYAPKHKELNEALGHAAAMVDAEVKSNTALEYIGQLRGEAATARRLSEEQTSKIERLDALKTRLTSELPIAGLDMTEEGLTYEGVPFDRVNTAMQYRIAVAVAALRAGKLGLILVDHAELLDAENWEVFSAAAAEAGVQLIAARVSDQPDLSVGGSE